MKEILTHMPQKADQIADFHWTPAPLDLASGLPGLDSLFRPKVGLLLNKVDYDRGQCALPLIGTWLKFNTRVGLDDAKTIAFSSL